MQLPDIDFLILVVHMLGLYLLAAAAEVNCQSPAASRGYRIGTTRLTNNKNLLVGDIISLTSGVYYLSPILIFINVAAVERDLDRKKKENSKNKKEILLETIMRDQPRTIFLL
jgi:hypothetical protein